MKILFTNATIYSMRFENESYKSLLVEDGRIIDVFQNIPTVTAEIIDLKGAFVYPGFIDTHTHSFEGGLYSLGVNLEGVKSIGETLELIRLANPIGGLVFAFHFDETEVAEKRFPTMKELDSLFPATPVLLRRVDGHSCVINTEAAKRITWNNALGSDFDGLLRKEDNDTAAHWFHSNLSEEAIIEAYVQASKIAIAGGHTTIHTMIGDAAQSPTHYALIEKNKAKFPIEFITYPQMFDVKKALELGAKRIGGCILADGSFGSHTAALTLPYADDPLNYGTLYHDDDFWVNFVMEAHNSNLQVAVHCIGDKAVNQILTAFETAQKQSRKDLRHELIHCELMSDDMIKRARNANVSCVMQPMFDRLWGGDSNLYAKVLGLDRAFSTNRLASITKQGILCTGGSDWYITNLQALEGIAAAVNHHNPKEALAHFEAVKLYTVNAAKLSHDENRLGTLAQNQQADFTCLESNIMNSKDIASIPILAVYKKGIRI
jgi:predicted amidohydrolase YtcJ